MAYCKYCGKYISDGESCDCAASKAAGEVKDTAEDIKDKAENAAETIQNKAENAAETVKNEAEAAAENVSEKVSEARSDAAEAIQNVKEKAEEAAKNAGNDIAKKVDGIAGDVAENLPGNMKNNKSLVYIAAGVIAALILLLLIALCSGGGPTSTVKKYIKASSDKHGAKTMYSLTLPKRVIKELKSDDEYEDMIDNYNDMVEDMIDDLEDKETLPQFYKITRKEALEKSELKMAEKYFEHICDKYDADEEGIRVTKGYEMKVKTRHKDEDGKKEHDKVTLCVVKLKGDGWKVIPTSVSGLSYYN